MGDVGSAHDDGSRPLVRGAEHVLGQRVVEHRRVEYLLFRQRRSPERVRVEGSVAIVLGRHLGEGLYRDPVLVHVPVGLHAEELGREELARLAIPVRQPENGRLGRERATGVLVHAHGDTDVVLSQSDGVSGQLDGAGGRGAGVEYVSKRNASESDQPRHRIRVCYLQAAAESKLDVLPANSGIVERRDYGIGPHLHGRLGTEPTKWVEADPDDGNVVHQEISFTGFSHGRECVHHDLRSVLVDEERNEGQFDFHAKPQFGGITLCQPALHLDHVAELHQIP